MNHILLFSFLCTSFLYSSPVVGQNRSFSVTVHELYDPDGMNPLTSSDASSQFIQKNIFQSLMSIDFATLELVPVLAESRPVMEVTKNEVRVTYSIRPQAQWDDGKPVTAKDVEFSFKAMICPGAGQWGSFYERIVNVELYPDDPLKITFVLSGPYLQAEFLTSEISVLPMHLYDPQAVFQNITVADIRKGKADDEKLKEFGTAFRSEKYSRDKDHIIGSGAYKIKRWDTGAEIVLERKQDWWGDRVGAVNSYFHAYPGEIIYMVESDMDKAVELLKNGKIDVMRSIKPHPYRTMKADKELSGKLSFHEPYQNAYSYIGINTRLSKFKDVKTRQALAHLVDVPKMIDKIIYGMGVQVTGPTHPLSKGYNHDVKPYEYSIEKAKELLAEAGWKDTDSDGLLDKKINGKLIPFVITFTFNSGNDMRKAAAMMFQEEARKVGINVYVEAQSWDVYLDKQKNHEFEMYFGTWISNFIPEDLTYIYHTSSYNGGSNYTGMGTAKTDKLIEQIRSEMDEGKRTELYLKVHKLIHEEAGYIFLYQPYERIITNSRFKTAAISMHRLGFWPAGFKLDD